MFMSLAKHIAPATKQTNRVKIAVLAFMFSPDSKADLPD
jgi:hypothetical protein